MTTSTITLPARAMADTIHRALSVMGREDPHPLLEYAHFWTQDGHLLMEASDQLRLLRTRTAAVSEDAVDVLVHRLHLSRIAGLVPDKERIPVPVYDYEEASTVSRDPAEGMEARIIPDESGISVTVGESTLRVPTAPVSDWDRINLAASWRSHMTSNHVSSTAWSPSLIAPLISAVATSEHVIADFREKTTLLTISDHSIALICALQYTASDLPKAAELWPDLLEETSR